MRKIIIFFVVIVSMTTLVFLLTRKKDNLEKKHNFAYVELYPEPKIENLNIGKTGKYGAVTTEEKVIRTMRFENITDAVEKKFRLPKKILLAMIMEESTGTDLLPNALDDGGFGLIHMQGSTASSFGLYTYGKCKELVCKKHGRALRSIIDKNNQDRKKVYMFDDRLHPILNINTAGKMLRTYMNKKPIPGYTRLESAVCRYAGKYNYKEYWKDIQANMALLKDKKYLKKVEDHFNQKNKTLMINGRSANFKDYIKVSQMQNFNYGLAYL